MKSIPLTQGMSSKVDDADFDSLNQHKWHFMTTSKHGYASRRDANGKTIYMHREIMNTSKGMVTDHINNNGLDNRRSNLRVCTSSQNNSNRVPTAKSGFKGVYEWINKGITYWRVDMFQKVKGKNKRVYCKYHKNPIDAAIDYNRKATELYGSFAKLNVIEGI
jgi:hypothetical protein